MPARTAVVDVKLLCKFATANATRESTIPFGAPVSSTQMIAVQTFLKRREPLKFLKCTRDQLRAYSRNEISFAAMPAETQTRLRQINALYAKPWSRKSATIVYAIVCKGVEPPKRKRTKKAPKSPTPATPEASVTA